MGEPTNEPSPESAHDDFPVRLRVARFGAQLRARLLSRSRLSTSSPRPVPVS
jgi:hypothetical protein